jgi:hypothetical protein
MSKFGNEMVAELANLLNKHEVGLGKTAAKKEMKEEKSDKKEKAEDKEEKADKKEKSKSKKKKKSDFENLLNNLVKLAEELDASGAEEAASLVDDALKVIVKNIKEDK